MEEIQEFPDIRVKFTNIRIYEYWYCEIHDVCYKILMKVPEESKHPQGNPCYGLDHLRYLSRVKESRCNFSYVGDRTYDGKTCIDDNTQQFDFSSRDGLFEREDLDFCQEISSD